MPQILFNLRFDFLGGVGLRSPRYRELELKGIILSEPGSGSFIQPQAPALAPRPKEKKAKLKNLYHRLLAEAASSGLTERELLRFIDERKLSI